VIIYKDYVEPETLSLLNEMHGTGSVSGPNKEPALQGRSERPGPIKEATLPGSRWGMLRNRLAQRSRSALG
jgi:hypothetical protein